MAEGWAHEWIRAEREKLDKCPDVADGKQLRAFLDGLVVASVALDESSVANSETTRSLDTSLISTSPTSSLTTNFGPSYPSATQGCVTCDGELCTSSSERRRRPKEKAIQAMAEDGIDISNHFAKSYSDILPLILDNQKQFDLSLKSWKRHLSFAGIRQALVVASREMGMAFAGVAANTTEETETSQVVDSLVVLCSCPDSMKRRLSNMSKETLDWDISPPSSAAKSEGDGAYLRVSRQIRDKVDTFMNQLKGCALLEEDGTYRYNISWFLPVGYNWKKGLLGRE